MTQLPAATRFVGRDDELVELLEALEGAASGRGGLILIGGEPGIGKSRLADELATRARAQGHLVLWGRGWEDAGAPPYWPWVQALRFHLRSSADDEIRQQLGPGAADVAQMLPELRDRLPDLAPPAGFDSASARFQLFDSTAGFLRNIARGRPVLIILDDLHAADTPTLLLLRFLASQLSDMAMLLVGTYRDVELTPDHPLTSAVAEMSREPTTRLLALAGLPADAVASYINAAANVIPNEQMAAAVWRATGGNPLFVGEAVRLLSSEGRLGEVADLRSLRVTVPPGVRAVIARRIGHLGEATAEALRLGAFLGPEFSLEVLCRIGDYEVDEAFDRIDAAVQSGLLLPVATGVGRYRFSHDLVRETLYDDLSPGRRARLHRRIADRLDEVYSTSTDVHLAELAFHHAQAVLQGDAAKGASDRGRSGARAIELAKRAGDEAARSLAYEEAIRLYDLAVTVLDRVGPDDATRAEILLALGEVNSRSRDLEAGRAAFLEAAEIARRIGDGPQLARAALGYSGRHIWARAGSDTRQVPLLQDAIELLGGKDERLRVRLLGRLACAWRSAPERRAECDTLSREAVEIARGLGDPATLSYALSARLQATWWPENPDERQSIAREMVQVAEALGDGERIADAHEVLFHSLIEAGRIEAARAEVAAVGRVVREFRQPVQLWLELCCQAELALLEGDFALAEDLAAREAAWEYRVSAARDEMSSARMHRFLLRREQGRLVDEEPTVRHSASELPWYPVHRAALLCLLCDLGRVAEARAMLDELSKDGFAALYRDSEWLLETSLAAEACAMLGDRRAAAVIYQQLAPFAGRHAVAHPEGSVGSVDRYLGRLAATLGRLDDGARHLTAAIEVNERMGARPWTAHSQHDLAEVLRLRGAPGDLDLAVRLDAAARATATAVGMVLADRIAPAPEVDLPATAAASSAATYQREGEYWTIKFGREVFRVRDSKGMRHLARLLRAPGQEIHALELARLDGPPTGPASATTTARIGRGGPDDLPGDGIGDAGPMLDGEAKRAYRERLATIREELAEAEAWNDPERVFRLQAEERALAHELAAALGLGGRDRAAASSAERARVSVTRALRAALARIAEQSQSLGDHFGATVRTGTFCSYVPDPLAHVTWRL